MRKKENTSKRNKTKETGERSMKRTKEKQENTITIPEEVRIPGSDVILEKGDRIEVEGKNNIKEATSYNVLGSIKVNLPGEGGVEVSGEDYYVSIESSARGRLLVVKDVETDERLLSFTYGGNI